jgi:catechol 2,3-dioxygenase-like lactoylglutathione lyase family enzyme
MTDIAFKAFVPILFVRNITASGAFFRDKLGFKIDFLYGTPPFYGSVSRGDACLHLRHVHRPNFAELAAREKSLILATGEVSDLQSLCEEFDRRGVEFAQRPIKQPWGGTEFHIRDPDGNVIAFVAFASHSRESARNEDD